MIRFDQFFDPAAWGPYTAVTVGIYFLLERRLRRVENQLSRLLGEEDARREVKR